MVGVHWLQGDDSASVGHATHRSSGSTDGHTAYVAGLEPICEAQMQVCATGIHCRTSLI